MTGRTDLWEPRDPAAITDWDAWQYDRDPNLQDALMAPFTAHHGQARQPQSEAVYRLIVEAVQADTFGGASIALSAKYSLVIFPAGSRGEDWRIFQPATDRPQLVIAGGMIE